MRHPISYCIFAITVAFALPLTASAAVHEIPSIDVGHTEDAASVDYMTGGIGDDERAAIEAARDDYNLHIMSASTNGAFVEDAQVVITKKGGEEVLNVFAGPLLYVKLLPGTYLVEASYGDETKKQTITISKKKPEAHVHLGWKTHATIADE